jgi:hypothetical protein
MTDLDTHSVLRKTEAGVNAIKLRDRSLTPKARMLLIVVDGHKSVGELTKAMPSPDEARQQLGELLSAGFVEMLDLPKPVAPAAASPAKASASPAADDLTPMIRRATHLLEDMLGPDSEALCLQIERCTSHAQFTAKIIEISRIVAAMRTEKKGAEFLLAATA